MLLGSADFWGVNTYGGKIAQWNDKAIGDYKPGDDIAERYYFIRIYIQNIQNIQNENKVIQFSIKR